MLAIHEPAPHVEVQSQNRITSSVQYSPVKGKGFANVAPPKYAFSY